MKLCKIEGCGQECVKVRGEYHDAVCPDHNRARVKEQNHVMRDACQLLGKTWTWENWKTFTKEQKDWAKAEVIAKRPSLTPHPASPPVPKERAATTEEQDDYERKLAVIREQEAGNTKQLDDTPTTRELYVVINDGSHTSRIKLGETRNFNVRKMMTGQTLDPDWKPRVVHRVWLLNITKAQATALEDKVFERMGNQGYTRVPHATTGNDSEWLAWPHFSEDQAVKDAKRYMNAIAKEWNDVHTHSGLGSEQPTAGSD